MQNSIAKANMACYNASSVKLSWIRNDTQRRDPCTNEEMIIIEPVGKLQPMSSTGLVDNRNTWQV